MRDLLVILHDIVEYASENYQLSENICIEYPKLEHKNIRILSAPELSRLENFLLHNLDPINLGITLCLYTELRLEEVCSLQWQNISFSNRILEVCRTVQRLKTTDLKIADMETVSL